MSKLTRTVNVGDVKIGGGNPVSIQSMCNTDTRDVASTVAQIKMLEEERKNIDNQINLLKKVLKASLAQAQRELENEL